MKSKIFTLLFFFSCTFIFAQKQTYNWVFGNGGGVSWNSGSPVAFGGSAISQLEGVACISDSNGVLLFYTDGMTCWNRNNVAMTNGSGLLGGQSSTQSAFIVPKPGSDSIYYLFTTDGNSYNYSEVDMSLNGGLGDINANKNIFMYTGGTEKLTAARHANGTDVWLLTHEYNTNIFHVYPITSAGIGAPALYSIGTVQDEQLGYMKVSPDGKKLACAIFSTGWVEFFDFNNANGVPSNPVRDTNFTVGTNDPYGCEFSPNSRYVYFDEEGGIGNVYQYDLQAGSAAAIIASRVILTTNTGNSFQGMQLAPDGKIYIADYTNNWLNGIMNPNVGGLACNLVMQAITLTPGATAQLGLPGFLQYSFSNNFYYIHTCLGDTTLFSLEQAADSAHWNFGDPSSGGADSANSLNPYHIFTAAGTFSVTVLTYTGAQIDTITSGVTIYSAPNINLGNDTAICIPGNVSLNATSAGAAYHWSTGASSAAIMVNTTGTYSVTVSVAGCISTDTIIVSASSGPVINLGNDTSVCIPDTLTLHAFYAGATYLWSNGSHADSLNVFATGTYGVTVLLGSCVSSDAINITEHPKPPASVTANQTVFCSGDTALICANTGMSAYLWNTGETTMCISTGLAGNYYVLLTDSNGCSASSNHLAITVYTSPPVSISVNGDTLSSYNASTYQWFLNGNIIPGATSQTYIATQGGSYTVEVTDTNGCNAFSTAVVISGILTPTLSQDEEAISVYPNPNSVGSWQLTVGKELLGSQFEIFDDRGRLVLISNIEQRRTNIELNVARGIYLLRVTSDKNRITRKLVKM